jgi:hypothetical protein
MLFAPSRAADAFTRSPLLGTTGVPPRAVRCRAATAMAIAAAMGRDGVFHLKCSAPSIFKRTDVASAARGYSIEDMRPADITSSATARESRRKVRA